jgi:hypothetical protein
MQGPDVEHQDQAQPVAARATDGQGPLGSPLTMGRPAHGDAVLSAIARMPTERRAAAMAELHAGGNAAVARGVARWAALARQEVAAPLSQVLVVSPETERRVVYAATVLHGLPPIDTDREARLDAMIGGSSLYGQIRERSAKQQHLDELRTSFADLEARARSAADLAPGETLPGGVPPSEEEMATLGEEIYAGALEVKGLDAAVQAELRTLGIGDERELQSLVEREFPELWVQRGKQIAYRMLDVNQAVAEAEMDRYRAQDMCILDVEELRVVDARLAVMARGQQSAAEQAAAAEGAREAKSEELRQAEDTIRWSQAPGGLPGGVPPSGEEIEGLNRDIARLEAEATSLRELEAAAAQDLDAARNHHAAQLPILLMDHYSPGMFENVSDEALGQMTGAMVQDVLDNIEETRENIANDEVRVWDLHEVPELTFQDLGVTRDSALGEAVEAHIADVRSDESALSIALGALALVAGIVAGVASGGLALFALAASSGIGVYQLSRSVSRYSAEAAAEEVSIDPAIADISANEPELMWVVLDVVGVVADVGGVVAALRPAARGLAAAGELGEFANEARRVAPEAADRLIASAERQVAAGSGRRISLLHGTEQRGLEGLEALGEGAIDVTRAPGAGQDLGRGFYLTTDRATAETYAAVRGAQRGGGMQHVLSFELPEEELGAIVDIRPGGHFRAEWEAYLEGPVEGVPDVLRSSRGFESVRSFLRGPGVEHRGEEFERFLRSIGMDNADTVFAPLGDGVFTGITSGGGETTQVCIRSQRVANRLNALIRGEATSTGP